MRAWENRPDTTVVDEPLYAHYLKETGIDHPGRDEIIAGCETDWRRVAAHLTGPIPRGRSIWYQKHMSHHLLAGIDRGWLRGLRHAFLIRDPAEMLDSLLKVTQGAGLEDTGLRQQVELFELVRSWTGRVPPVVDARDVLDDPRGVLSALCEALGVSFREEMLSWPPGRRETDGMWSPYWYAAVERSTGFQPHKERKLELPSSLKDLHEACRGLYERLHAHRLTAGGSQR